MKGGLHEAFLGNSQEAEDSDGHGSTTTAECQHLYALRALNVSMFIRKKANDALRDKKKRQICPEVNASDPPSFFFLSAEAWKTRKPD